MLQLLAEEKQRWQIKRNLNHRLSVVVYLVVLASLCSFDLGSESTLHGPAEKETFYIRVFSE